MNKLFLFILVLVFVGIKTNAQTVVGKIENGIARITLDKSVLKAKWEKYLITAGIRNANIGDFAIQKSIGGDYFLVSTDFTVRDTLTNKYGVALTHKGMKLVVGQTSCTCIGCTSGCSPKENGNKWTCTSCKGGKPDCNKTETAISEGSLF